MKKRKLKKLTLKKNIISDLQKRAISGGSQLCLQSVQGSPIECASSVDTNCIFACA